MSLCAIVILKLPDLLSFSSGQVSSRRQLLPCGSLRARRSPAPSFLSLMSIHCSGTLSISKADTAESRTHHRKREAAGVASSDSQERLATCITSESVLHCACHCVRRDETKALRPRFSPAREREHTRESQDLRVFSCPLS
jgi:hypothetical protein